MEVEGRALGPARTNFNDYVGTVAADDAEAVLDRPSLYELAKIDRDRYTVLGIDLRVDGSTTASIYAIDRVEHRISLNGTDIVELGQSWGEIPVVQFNLPEPNVEDFIRHALKRISIRLVTQALRDQVLVVTELRRLRTWSHRGSSGPPDASDREITSTPATRLRSARQSTS